MQVNRISNIFWVATSNLVLLLANFGVSILLANHLGASDFGIFMLGYTIFNYFVIINNYGLKKYVITNLSSNQYNFQKIYSSSIVIKLFLSIITSLVLVVVLYYLDLDSAKKVSIVIFYVASFLLVFDLQAFYDSYEKSKIDSFFLIARNFLYFSITLFLVFSSKASVVNVSLAFLITTLIYIVLQYSLVKKYVAHIKLFFSWNYTKTVLVSSLPLFWAELMINIYDKADIIMLSVMKGDEIVGIYSVAARLVAAIILLVGAAYRVILPSLSKVSGTVERNSYIEKAIKYLGIITIPITIGGIAVAPQLIDLLFDSEYKGAVIAFQILLLNVSIVGMGAVFGTYLLAVGQVRHYSLAITFGAIINMVGNFILIPDFGYIGASVTTVLAQFIVSAVSFYIYRRTCNPRFKFNLLKVIFISILLGIVAYLLSHIIPILLNISLCIIIYFSMLLISKIIVLRK